MYSFDWVYFFEKYWVDVFFGDKYINMYEDFYYVNREVVFIKIYKFLMLFYIEKKISDLLLGGWRIIKFFD